MTRGKAKPAKRHAHANGKARGPRAPPMQAGDQDGEMNAHISERVGRSNYQVNDNSSQPKPRPPPSSVLDKEVQRYFDGPLHQETLSRWQQLSEIPTARELLRPQYVLIDDSHLQEPSDDQPGWGDGNTWGDTTAGGNADGFAVTDVVDDQWKEPFVSAWEEPAQTDFSQASGDDWDVPGPAFSWEATKPSADEFGVSTDEFAVPASTSLDDEFCPSGDDFTVTALTPSASKTDDDQTGGEDARSSTTEVPPNGHREALQHHEETAASDPRPDADDTQGSHGIPQDPQNEQSTQATSGHGPGGSADNEGSTNDTTGNDVAASSNDEEDDIADLDSQEPSRLQAFNSLGPWASKKKYLHTHYMLLREDALRHLKEAIQTLRSNPNMTERDGDKSVGIYDGVRVRGLTLANRGLGVKISFDLSRVGKQIKWDQSSRLVPGSLVVLVPFEDSEYKIDDLIVATIAARPLLEVEQCKIDLFFARPEEIEIDTSKRWLMLEERTGFFEAERYTLRALQRMVHESTPFTEQLVEGTKEVDHPEYLKDRPALKLDNVPGYNHTRGRVVDAIRDWPSQLSVTLDPSQQDVLKRIVTKRLALCQGPPGTGKTYVSVQALRVMLDNMSKKDPPIIIACHTNHALDQLLREVDKLEHRCFVRVGGRSQDKEIIKPQTIYELKHNEFDPMPRASITSKAKHTLTTLGIAIQRTLKPLQAHSEGKFDLDVFEAEGILTHGQKTSLERNAAAWESSEHSNDETNALIMWAARAVKPPEALDDATQIFPFEEVELEREELVEKDAEAAPADEDADADKLLGNYLELAESMVCTTPNARMRVRQSNGNLKQFESMSRLLHKTEDLAMVSSETRGLVYEHLIKRLKESLRDEIRRLAIKYAEAVKQRTIGMWTESAWLLKQHKIVGMTTTGLSKYRALIAAVKPRVVMIEEAGEALEAPVIAGALESVQHLILVGDHQQLKPHLHVHELEGSPYHLDRSLLERLVEAGVEYDQLQTQRRMVPEVSRLLGPIYGEGTIKDHQNMSDPDVRAPVPGMNNRLWFFNHQWPESRDNQMSSLNKEEAAMIVGFLTHLYRNGLPLRHITILNFYNGQRRELAYQLRRAPLSDIRESWNEIKIVTVDSYQGEENEVVILSLVRNNEKSSIGFLESVNRACVALSRAKRGFYMFGNSQLLSTQSILWQAVLNEIQEQGAYGEGELPLAPCAHYEEGHRITQPSDWTEPAPKMGGCDQACGKIRECGHDCKDLCHPGMDHRDTRCHAPCDTQLPCGHPCKLECSDFQHQCGKCQKPRTMSVDRPPPPPTESTGARGSGANAVPVTNPRIRGGETVLSTTSTASNGSTRGYHPSPSTGKARPAPDIGPTPPKPKSYSMIANQPRPSAASIREQQYPALGSSATPKPQPTLPPTKGGILTPRKKPSSNDARKGSPDKWETYANGGVKQHDAELQAMAGVASGGRPQETAGSIAASIAEKAKGKKPATVRTQELSPAKSSGGERRRWRDRYGAGSGHDEQLVSRGVDHSPQDARARAIAGAGTGTIRRDPRNEDLLIDFGGDEAEEAEQTSASPGPVVEEGDLIDLMD